MLRLLALSPEDGWAFVALETGEIRRLRPPYRQTDAIPVSNDAIGVAVTGHGFSATEQDFPDWASLINYLRSEISAAIERRGGLISLDEIRSGLLETAPANVIEGFLDRVENEFLPKRLYAEASNLLTNLLATKQIESSKDLYNRTLSLLLRTERERNRTTIAMRDLALEGVVTDERFPHAANRYGTDELRSYCDEMRRRHQPLAFAA
jgi:hypothetical protein